MYNIDFRHHNIMMYSMEVCKILHLTVIRFGVFKINFEC